MMVLKMQTVRTAEERQGGRKTCIDYHSLLIEKKHMLIEKENDPRIKVITVLIKYIFYLRTRVCVCVCSVYNYVKLVGNERKFLRLGIILSEEAVWHLSGVNGAPFKASMFN